MAVRQVPVVVLEFVQVFYQQVAGTRSISQEAANVSQRLVGCDAALDTTLFAARAFHNVLLIEWKD